MGNSFGQLFRVTTFGESHGAGVGAVIDGCPPGVPLAAADIQPWLDRRRPGQSALATPRDEADAVEILSGVFDGRTTGTPIALLARNNNARSGDYDNLRDTYRPSHADFTYDAKYGFRDYRGGGRASARETIGRVAAGAVAAKVLAVLLPALEIRAYVESVQDIAMPPHDTFPTLAEVDASPVRCPDPAAAALMAARIAAARDAGDSVGGVIRCRVRGAPAGLGEPVFDRLEADLAKAMLSIPASKGFEIGSGFAGVLLAGSAHNDAFVVHDGKVCAETNRSGGVQGGISNGAEVFFRTAFKPVATISLPQRTVDKSGAEVLLAARGRHDPCVLPRAVPIIEAMTALVFLDHFLRDHAQNHSTSSALFSAT
ncbi:MAG: chorismate synthase [Puniceicoccales bacterium]|jgi:chorismate synthase|nr:chorismate synthase [Puniceicoccales bacterium]